MNQTQWTLLAKLPDLIQRDALVYQLGENRIEVMAPDRDVIVNLGGGPNLALEGYSAIFDGYSVLVQTQDLARAKEILNTFYKTPNSDTPSAVDWMSKFHLSAILSFILPGVLHITALLHLKRAIENKQFSWSLKTVFSMLIFVATLSVIVVFLQNWV